MIRRLKKLEKKLNILIVDGDVSEAEELENELNREFDIVGTVFDGMKAFHGNLIIQTMFMKGKTEDGIDIDNTSDSYVLPWLEAVKDIAPREVMIYTIDRETPDQFLQKASHEELDRIVALVKAAGIDAQASY